MPLLKAAHTEGRDAGFQQRLQGLQSVFTPLESYVPNDLSRVRAC